jgi:hypothetical protein
MMALSAETSWSAASRHVWSGLSDRDEFRDTIISPRPAQEVGLADRRTLSHPWRRMNFEPVPSLANVSSRVIFYRVTAVPARVRMRVRFIQTGIAEGFLHSRRQRCRSRRCLISTTQMAGRQKTKDRARRQFCRRGAITSKKRIAYRSKTKSWLPGYKSGKRLREQSIPVRFSNRRVEVKRSSRFTVGGRFRLGRNDSIQSSLSAVGPMYGPLMGSALGIVPFANTVEPKD